MARLLYTGATVRHCQIAMLKRQKKLLEIARKELKGGGEELEQRVLELAVIDTF